MIVRDSLQHTATRRARAGKLPMTERTISHYRDVMPFAPGDHGMLNGAFLHVLQHLVTSGTRLAGDGFELPEIRLIEVADPP